MTINDPRQVGQALWPNFKDINALLITKATLGETIFDCEYQGAPTKREGNIIKDRMLPIIDASQIPMQVWGASKWFIADTAYTKKEENDPSAVACVKFYMNRVYIWDYIEFRERSYAAKKRIIEFMEINEARHRPIFIENKASGITYADDLVDLEGINAIEYKHPGKDKLALLESNIGYLETQRIILVKGIWNEKFKKVAKEFPRGKHDEPIDIINMTCSLCFNSDNNYERSITTI